MITLVFTTRTHRPNARISIRGEIEGWDRDVHLDYHADEWRVQLDEAVYNRPFQCKFVLDETFFMVGVNLVIDPVPGSTHRFGEATVRFEDQPWLIVENSQLARRFLAPNVDEGRLWDVIVVGSGAGGGTVADQLSDQGADVLVLEIGSYLFPTHVANLPREHLLGLFDKHVWRLWNRFQVKNYQNGPGSNFQGANGFVFGGRTVYWGGLTPRMRPYEMAGWPAGVVAFLSSLGYRRAEEALNAREPTPSIFQKDIKRTLKQILPDFEHVDASLAVQYSGLTSTAIASGLYSTADVLLESRLTQGAGGNDHLTVNLNHRVVGLEENGATVTAVVAQDLVAGVTRRYRARHVVLAAGTLETPRIAKAAKLRDPTGRIGVGITDHPIYFTHFRVPPGNPGFGAGEASKTISRDPAATADRHPYNVVVELGADFNQGRYLDDELLAEHIRRRGEFTLGEIVILFNAPLKDDNRVDYTGPGLGDAVVHMQPTGAENPHLDEARQRTKKVHDGLGAVNVPNEELALNRAFLGGVAHEVGTMRMAGDGSGVVDGDLRVLDYENLFVCDLSVFPSSPAANPTLTLVALAIRLADHLLALPR